MNSSPSQFLLQPPNWAFLTSSHTLPPHYPQSILYGIAIIRLRYLIHSPWFNSLLKKVQQLYRNDICQHALNPRLTYFNPQTLTITLARGVMIINFLMRKLGLRKEVILSTTIVEVNRKAKTKTQLACLPSTTLCHIKYKLLSLAFKAIHFQLNPN